jgi:exonuclease 3'-5' domain-containing protein 1
MQISLSPDEVALVDARVLGTVEALAPILTDDNYLKILHDCREDSAALFHQFGKIRMRGVFDTQTVSLIAQRLCGINPLHQQSYMDLAREYGLCDEQFNDTLMKAKMSSDPELWYRRPLSKDLVDYAVLGVKFLVPLYERMARKYEVMDSVQIREACDSWVDYCDMNAHIKKPSDVEKIGYPIMGMVAAINDRGVYFKLNIGRTGVCSTPSALKRMLHGGRNFVPVQVGDTVELSVSGISIDGRTIYVDRRDPDWEYFDFLRRPSPNKKDSTQEYLHVPSVVEDDGGIDPLLRRGLSSDGGFESDEDDEVDHDPILTRKPTKK